MTDILIGDALAELRKFPGCSIDMCVTSPPYYGVRDYGVNGQIGLEKSLEDYINRLVEVFREVRRVLKDSGTLWLNLGDSYAGSGKLFQTSAPCTVKPKDLMGLPWRLAFALQKDGWYLRQDIIWHKPNAMPESVKDRCTKSHEYIFLLSKSRKYYFDHNAIKEPAVGFDISSPRGSKGTLTPNAGRRKGNSKSFRGGGAYTSGQSFDNSVKVERETHGNVPNETGSRNKRDVWTVSTKGYSGAHFATFPEKLIEPCILAGCFKGGIVLDPFLGSGTTAAVAKRLGRNCIGIELNPEYVEMAKRRLEVQE